MRLRMHCLEAGVGRIETDKESVILWMARTVDREETRELFRANRRAQFQPDRIVLYVDKANPLRAVESMVDLLRKRGGQTAAQAVQKRLQAAQTAETMATAAK
jgi:biopolymer transport protein ExbD